MQDGLSKIKKEPGRHIGLAGSGTAVSRASSIDHVFSKFATFELQSFTRCLFF